jgi:hypothetical protein
VAAGDATVVLFLFLGRGKGSSLRRRSVLRISGEYATRRTEDAGTGVNPLSRMLWRPPPCSAKIARLGRVRGGTVEQPSFGVIMLATIIIGFWSLMSGTVVVMGLAALGIDLGIEPLRLFLGHSP